MKRNILKPEVPLHPETRSTSEDSSHSPRFSTPAHTAATGGHHIYGARLPARSPQPSRADLAEPPSRVPRPVLPRCVLEPRTKRQTHTAETASQERPRRLWAFCSDPPPPARSLRLLPEPCRWRKQALPLPRGQALFFHRFILEDSISGVGTEAPSPLS